jgi:hypothetical protein
MDQASFDFTTPPRSPESGEVEILVAYLLNHPGFHTARELADALAYNERKIRQLAEQSDSEIVSGPGSPGYIHITHCPTEKVHHITSKMISQGKTMIRRALATRRKAHSIIR